MTRRLSGDNAIVENIRRMKAAPMLRSAHRTILLALTDVHYMTYRQGARYGFSASSYTHVSEFAADLIRWGYVAYDFERRGSEVGRSKRILMLTERGRRYCQEALTDAILPRTPRLAKESFQAHTLGITELACVARDFAKAHPDRVVIDALATDLSIKRSPVMVRVSGREMALVPDLWESFLIDGQRRSFAVEYDRGHETREQWEQKLDRLVAGLGGALQARFGVVGCQVPVVIHPEPRRIQPQKRADLLVSWTGEYLVRKFPNPASHTGWGRLFSFAALDPATCDVTGFYLAPWWRSPLTAAPHPLIEQPSDSHDADTNTHTRDDR